MTWGRIRQDGGAEPVNKPDAVEPEVFDKMPEQPPELADLNAADFRERGSGRFVAGSAEAVVGQPVAHEQQPSHTRHVSRPLCWWRLVATAFSRRATAALPLP